MGTAQDCLHFTTKFFEPINVSATHIYHSALELCPISSIVRKLYYDRCHGITRFPRVVIGTPDSWDPTISFSCDELYGSCTWSPCGRSIAARRHNVIEIRNPLTFELLTILQSTRDATEYRGPLTYSPDGRSIASGFPDTIIIWDIQTGGVTKQITCGGDASSLVWSLDGERIGVTLYSGLRTRSVETYDAVSGVQLVTKEFWGDPYFCLWACQESFRLVEVQPFHSTATVYEIGLGSIVIQSSHSTTPSVAIAATTFSPSTYHILLHDEHNLYRIIDIQTSDCLLELHGFVGLAEFSADGSLFATLVEDTFSVWRYTSDSYALLRNYPRGLYISSLYFSPTSSSILTRSLDVLQVRRLDDPPLTPVTCRQHVAISGSGTYIATARESEETVTTISLRSQAPVQVIDTGGKVDGMVITGNILLVASSETVTAWLVMGEGRVDSPFDSKGACRSDSIWSTSSPSGYPRQLHFKFGRKVGAIGTYNRDIDPFIYHTGTGNVLDRTHIPQHFSCSWISFYEPMSFQDHHHLHYPNLSPRDPLPENDWPISYTAMKEVGWVMDPEGRHRFWFPVEWRKSWRRENWYYDITTLFFNNGEKQPVVIKF